MSLINSLKALAVAIGNDWKLLAAVAKTGSYSDLIGKPTLFDPASPGPIGGTAANTGAFTDLTISGNLTVSGTTTSVNATNLDISDPLIYMAKGNTANVNDIGIAGHFNNGTYQHTGLVRKAADGKWYLFSGVTTEPTSGIGWTDPTFAKDTLVLGGLEATSVSVNGEAVATQTWVGAQGYLTSVKTINGNSIVGTGDLAINASWSGGTLTTTLTLAVGTTTVAPLDFQSGVLLTTPIAGGVEYDGKLKYFTPYGTLRGLSPAVHYYRKNTATTLTSATGNQSVLGLTSGVSLNANTIYEVDGEFELTTTGTTSHTESFGFVLTTAVLSNMGVSVQRWTAAATAATGGMSLYLTAVAPTAITAALTTAQTVVYRVRGTIAITTAGSVNPVIAFSAAPGGTSTIVAGAWFKFTPIGTAASNVSIGTWA